MEDVPFAIDGCACYLLSGTDTLHGKADPALKVMFCEEHKQLVDEAALDQAMIVLKRYTMKLEGTCYLIVSGISLPAIRRIGEFRQPCAAEDIEQSV